jgi:hypothetical protein
VGFGSGDRLRIARAAEMPQFAAAVRTGPSRVAAGTGTENETFVHFSANVRFIRIRICRPAIQTGTTLPYALNVQPRQQKLARTRVVKSLGGKWTA